MNRFESSKIVIFGLLSCQKFDLYQFRATYDVKERKGSPALMQSKSARISACCETEDKDVNVSIAEDGSATSYTTPHAFSGFSGPHTFSVPNTDASGHSFLQWSMRPLMHQYPSKVQTEEQASSFTFVKISRSFIFALFHSPILDLEGLKWGQRLIQPNAQSVGDA